MAAALDLAAVKSSRRGLAFRQWGRGPSLVLLHGGVGSWTHWVRNIESMAAHFTVHALDLPGFGESSDVAKDVSPDAYLDWVAAVVKDVAVQSEGGQTGIVGFSFGAVVAAAVASRIGTFARKLTLIGPGGFGEPVGRDLPLRKRPADKSDVVLLREVTAFNLGQWMLNTAPSVDDPVVDLHMANLDRARYDSRLVGWRATLLPDLQSMSCPAQILWGEHDRLAHPSIEVRRTQCLAVRPDLETAVIPVCSHWSQYADPHAIDARLLAFHGPNNER